MALDHQLRTEQQIDNAEYIVALSAKRVSLGGAADDNRVSAVQGDAANMRVSAIQDDASNLMVSAKSDDASNMRVSALGVNIADVSNDDAADFRVSCFSQDGGVYRTSAVQSDASNLNVSAKNDDAALFRTSSIIDSGSVSASQPDAGNLRTSAIQDDASNLNVSAKSDDGAFLRTSSVLVANYSDSAVDNVRIDSATNTLQVIDYEHHEIHSGSHYYYCDYVTLDSTEDIDFQLTTPDTTKWIHMTWQLESTGEVEFNVYEDAIVSSDGTAVSAFNNDRNSVNTTDLTLFQYDGTVVSAGNKILGESFGVTSNPAKSIGGAGERERELILKQNTTYRFFIESNSNDNIISYCGEWYEHTNKR